MSGPERLHADDLAALIDGVAERVAAALSHRPAVAPLLNVKETAAMLAVTEEWVRENAEAIGVLRLGDGPRPRLRFDPDAVRRALTSRAKTEPSHCSANSGEEPREPRVTVATAGNAVTSLPLRELEPRRPTKRPGGVGAPRAMTPGGQS
jgi:hypothetical protein